MDFDCTKSMIWQWSKPKFDQINKEWTETCSN